MNMRKILEISEIDACPVENECHEWEQLSGHKKDGVFDKPDVVSECSRIQEF